MLNLPKYNRNDRNHNGVSSLTCCSCARWVLIPHEGCQECDSCTDALLFSVEDQRDLLANETQDFKVTRCGIKW